MRVDQQHSAAAYSIPDCAYCALVIFLARDCPPQVLMACVLLLAFNSDVQVFTEASELG